MCFWNVTTLRQRQWLYHLIKCAMLSVPLAHTQIILPKLAIFDLCLNPSE